MFEDKASAFFLSGPGCKSGWALAWSCRNSDFRDHGSMVKGDLGGGPCGSVFGKSL